MRREGCNCDARSAEALVAIMTILAGLTPRSVGRHYHLSNGCSNRGVRRLLSSKGYPAAMLRACMPRCWEMTCLAARRQTPAHATPHGS